MNKETAKKLYDALDQALKELSSAFGVEMRIAQGRYRHNIAEFRVEAVDVPSTKDKRILDFKTYASMHGLRQEDLHRRFNYLGCAHEVVGLAVKDSRFPVVCRRLDNGKTYRFMTETVRAALDRASSRPEQQRLKGRRG